MRIQAIAVLALAAILNVSIHTLGSPINSETPSVTTTVNPYRALIFREIDLDGSSGSPPPPPPPPPLDSELTAAEQIEKLYSVGDDQGVDPAAYIKMGFWDEWYINKDPAGMGSDEQALQQPHVFDFAFEHQRMQYNLTIAKAKLNSMFKKSRKPARSYKDIPAIRLGASLQPHETLASNLNTYVPDGFNDGEIAHMFKINEALRMGEKKSLNATELAKTNSHLLDLYLRALAGHKGPVGIDPVSKEAGEECPICKDTLDAEPSFHLLSCGHRFHTDCATNSMELHSKYILKCPLCRQRLRQSFDLSEAP